MSHLRKGRPANKSIDWTFWRMQAHVQGWEAAALSIGLNPEAMVRSAHAWMVPTSRAIFEAHSFQDVVQKHEFEKRYRLVESWVEQHGDKVTYFNFGRVELAGVARWLVSNGLNVPSELRDIVEPNATQSSSSTPAPSTSGTSDTDSALADLFDPVGTSALEKMFPTATGKMRDSMWPKWAEHASENGLIDARTARGRFNPVLAARWWLTKHNPQGWDWARCKRRLAANLPERSSDYRAVLLGDNAD